MIEKDRGREQVRIATLRACPPLPTSLEQDAPETSANARHDRVTSTSCREEQIMSDIILEVTRRNMKRMTNILLERARGEKVRSVTPRACPAPKNVSEAKTHQKLAQKRDSIW